MGIRLYTRVDHVTSPVDRGGQRQECSEEQTAASATTAGIDCGVRSRRIGRRCC